MLVATGFFDKVGNPCIKIVLSGAFSGSIEIDAIIDTGFTGFLTVPLIQVFPLGLPLFGTTGLTLADGTTNNRMTALGKVTLGAHANQGVVVLEPDSNECLVGMDFLRSFKLSLVMTKDQITLFDEDVLDQIKMVAEAHMAKPKPPSETLLPTA